MSAPLPPDRLAARLAEVYLIVGPLYRKASRAVERDQPITGMSVGVRAVLEQLHREGDLTVPAIAASQELSRQFVQRMVHEAREAGFVELVDNPRHLRSSLVRLADEGRAAIAAVIAREHRLLSRAAGDLTDADVDTALRVLRSMLAGVNDVLRSRAESTEAAPDAC
ncbi:helix-turn-helix domain-containing protein [Streptosporangium sp. NPDC049248]|uniref:MarR family winged helix-turn-helix transcriptional regulator n=1 Tax=Streptosporangium sp. NPDC049248 TaxID=3155651 RepID=UPI003438E24F